MLPLPPRSTLFPYTTLFRSYYAHLAPGIGNGALQERLTANALVALLEKLGPSVVLIHSQPGTALWVMADTRSEEHTSELQSHHDLVCRLLLEKKKNKNRHTH